MSKITENSAGGDKDVRIRNKMKRQQVMTNVRKDKKLAKKTRQKERRKVREKLGDQAPPKLVPQTIDSLRHADETRVGVSIRPYPSDMYDDVKIKSEDEEDDKSDVEEIFNTDHSRHVEQTVENEECDVDVKSDEEEDIKPDVDEINSHAVDHTQYDQQEAEREDLTGDQEVKWDIDQDSFASYFSKQVEPKLLLTCNDSPHAKTRAFMKEMARVIPNTTLVFRRRVPLKKMIRQAVAESFTDVLVVDEDGRLPTGLIISHLPDGPTARFRLSNVKLARELYKDWRQIDPEARPEVVVTNFTTRLGLTIGRMLAAIFNFRPVFNAARCVTFHNQRDYIFFRSHTYLIKQQDSSGKPRVRLREMGPRFTMRLQSLQAGTFDSQTADYEWTKDGKRHELESCRRKFHL